MHYCDTWHGQSLALHVVATGWARNAHFAVHHICATAQDQTKKIFIKIVREYIRLRFSCNF